MPVPTAAERTGLDTVTYPDGSVDTLMVPVDPGIAAVLARYPLPNYTSGSYQAHTFATASKGGNRRRPVLHPPGPQDFRQRSVSLPASTSTTSTARPPIPTKPPSIPPLVWPMLTVSAMWWAPGRVPLRHALVLESSVSITRSTPGLSHQLTRPTLASKKKVQRRTL